MFFVLRLVQLRVDLLHSSAHVLVDGLCKDCLEISSMAPKKTKIAAADKSTRSSLPIMCEKHQTTLNSFGCGACAYETANAVSNSSSSAADTMQKRSRSVVQTTLAGGELGFNERADMIAELTDKLEETSGPPQSLMTKVSMIQHMPEFFEHDYHAALLGRLANIREFAVTHHMRMYGKDIAVTSRPKWVAGTRNDRGEFGVYDWGQTLPFHGMISDAPPLLLELRDVIGRKVPFANLCNHWILTFSTKIPPHMDKAHSSGCASRKFAAPEDSADIVLCSFGSSTSFKLTDPSSEALLGTVDFDSGSVIVLPGAANCAVKHSAEPGDGDDIGIRISVVLRKADRDWVNIDENYMIVNGKKKQIPVETWSTRQPELPASLAAPLLMSATPLAPSGLTEAQKEQIAANRAAALAKRAARATAAVPKPRHNFDDPDADIWEEVGPTSGAAESSSTASGAASAGPSPSPADVHVDPGDFNPSPVPQPAPAVPSSSEHLVPASSSPQPDAPTEDLETGALALYSFATVFDMFCKL